MGVVWPGSPWACLIVGVARPWLVSSLSGVGVAWLWAWFEPGVTRVWAWPGPGSPSACPAGTWPGRGLVGVVWKWAWPRGGRGQAMAPRRPARRGRGLGVGVAGPRLMARPAGLGAQSLPPSGGHDGGEKQPLGEGVLRPSHPILPPPRVRSLPRAESRGSPHPAGATPQEWPEARRALREARWRRPRPLPSLGSAEVEAPGGRAGGRGEAGERNPASPRPSPRAGGADWPAGPGARDADWPAGGGARDADWPAALSKPAALIGRRWSPSRS